jgi:hypothetical protein
LFEDIYGWYIYITIYNYIYDTICDSWISFHAQALPNAHNRPLFGGSFLGSHSL